MRAPAGNARGIVWFADDVTERFRLARVAREQEIEQVAVSRLEAQLAQAQLQVLQTQLDPHFMFNTLNSIAALMRRNVAQADRMLVRLGDLLRLSLRHSMRPGVTLRDELALLAVYLEIEQARYGDRLQTSLQIDPSALPVLVPHLVLQPLVENALRHGIGPQQGLGLLSIQAWVKDGFLQLEVRDNGRGLAAEWPALKLGLGISNTMQRLERLYGADHHFEIVPIHQGGVLVRLSLPARTDDPPGSDHASSLP
jgi:LytS/YehU family sensor histidine kinase